MQSKAKTVAQYLASLPAERREAIVAVRKVILANLDRDLEEGMQYGMIGYYVPHSVFPDGYHCDPKQPVPYAGLASQKNYMSLYVMVTWDEAQERWLREAFAKAGKKLDMGKCCVRFKRLEDLPLDVVGRLFKRSSARKFIAHYEREVVSATARKAAGRAKKKTAKAGSARKTARKAAKKAPARKKATRKA